MHLVTICFSVCFFNLIVSNGTTSPNPFWVICPSLFVPYIALSMGLFVSCVMSRVFHYHFLCSAVFPFFPYILSCIAHFLIPSFYPIPFPGASFSTLLRDLSIIMITGTCTVFPMNRKECGSSLPELACKALGCCYEGGLNGIPSCYKKQ